MERFKISLKAARVNANFTIEEASKNLGVSTDTLIKWEKEPWKMSVINSEKISKLYNIDLNNINFLPTK